MSLYTQTREEDQPRAQPQHRFRMHCVPGQRWGRTIGVISSAAALLWMVRLDNGPQPHPLFFVFLFVALFLSTSLVLETLEQNVDGNTQSESRASQSALFGVSRNSKILVGTIVRSTPVGTTYADFDFDIILDHLSRISQLFTTLHAPCGMFYFVPWPIGC